MQLFRLSLMRNIFALHDDLVTMRYRHGPYHAFNINDPKPRSIHKASVRDRLLHHSLYRMLYPFFAKNFITDSFSCQRGKGTHKAVEKFRSYSLQVSKNNTTTCWVLKCDIKKFFANIDHDILDDILAAYISDPKIGRLIRNIIESFSTHPRKGLPLGNLTSQLLVNIYMNEFDVFVKHRLRVKHYVRYADDFVLLSQDRRYLEKLLLKIGVFLSERLRLQLHPSKVSIEAFASGVDFLGWVHFPTHRVLRTVTKKRMFKNLAQNDSKNTLHSYLGLLKHGDTYVLQKKISNPYES